MHKWLISVIMVFSLSGILLFTGTMTSIAQCPVNPDFSFTQSCNEFQFTDESVVGSGTITSWLWDFGDGNTSGDQNPLHSYSADGNYTVELTLYHSTGCDTSFNQEVSIFHPNADFSFTEGCATTVINFTDNSTPGFGSIDSWHWDFGDGNTSTMQNPGHAFNDPGFFDVTLIATNSSGCNDTIAKPVEVDSLPAADFTYTPACLGTKTYFYDQSIPNADSMLAWVWIIDGTVTITKQNINYSFDETGSHSVILTVINSNGCIDTYEVTIDVDYPPIAEFSTDQVCFGDSTHFTNSTTTQGVPIAEWLWNFDDPPSGVNNTSQLENPSHLYSTEGFYDPFLIAINTHGCADTAWSAIPVAVDSIPSAEFQAGSEPVGVPVEFYDFSQPHGSPITQWFWTFGDGGTSPNNNPTHIYNTPGNFEVWLKVSDAEGCVDSVVHVITVTALPVANFSHLPAGSDLSVQFTDISQPASGLQIVDWYWNFGVPQTTSDTSTFQNPLFTFPESDEFDITLIIKDSNGGISDTTKTIFVGELLIADFDADAVCEGNPTTFTDLSQGSQITQIEKWEWTFGDGNDTTFYDTTYVQQFEYVYETGGQKSVHLIVYSLFNNEIITDTIQHTIMVHPTPMALFDTVSVCIGDTAYFWDESEDFGEPIISWYWIFGDGSVKAARHTTHIYNDTTGIYQTSLIVRNGFGCTDTLTQNTWVSTIPEADFIFTTPCIDNPVNFSGTYDSTATEVTFWSWDFGDPSDTSNVEGRYVDHSFKYVGIYRVELTIGNSGCTTKLHKDILFYPNPFSDFEIESNFEGYAGQTFFENKSIFATKYDWDFGNGNTSDDINPVEVYEEDSTYMVRMIALNEYGCTDTSYREHSVVFKGLYIPTAFSPNNPNPEVARFIPKGYDIAEYLIQIYDTRGNLLWESDAVDAKGRPVEGWDGYYDGLLMPQGTYIWKAKATFKDKTAWPGTIFQGVENPRRQGTVTLIR